MLAPGTAATSPGGGVAALLSEEDREEDLPEVETEEACGDRAEVRVDGSDGGALSLSGELGETPADPGTTAARAAGGARLASRPAAGGGAAEAAATEAAAAGALLPGTQAAARGGVGRV